VDVRAVALAATIASRRADAAAPSVPPASRPSRPAMPPGPRHREAPFSPPTDGFFLALHHRCGFRFCKSSVTDCRSNEGATAGQDDPGFGLAARALLGKIATTGSAHSGWS